ncbi:kinase-like domain-containing protein [Camillea tinctor]|nr:kinase-like domain-containing protein [Camillea tinctor]
MSKRDDSGPQDDALEPTNPFSEGDIEQRLYRDLGMQPPPYHSQSASSEKTNSFPEGYVENRVNEDTNQKRFLVSDLEIRHLDARLLIQPSDLSQFKNRNGQWERLCRRTSFRDPPGMYIECLTVTQNKEDVSCLITEPLTCELFYDVYTDFVAVVNRSLAPFYMRRPATTGEDGEPYAEIQPFACLQAGPGAWTFCLQNDVVAFQMMVFPRTFSLALLRPYHIPSLSGSKRRRSEEQQASIAPTEKEPVVVKPLGALTEMTDGESVRIATAGTEEYRVLRMRRSGATRSAEVFQAKVSSYPDKIVVVKVFKKDSGSIVARCSSWSGEFSIHRKLRSDVIAELLGGDARLNALFIQWIDACDLGHKNWRHVENDRFRGDRTDAIRVLSDMARALQYLRNEGVLHNDIKPSNILYGRDSGAILIDFGLATSLDGPARVGGTPWYVAPEYLYSGERKAAAEIWALGVVMIFLLGKVPLPDLGWQVQSWIIKDMRGSSAVQNRATQRMEEWLQVVRDATTSLATVDTLHSIVLRMLEVRSHRRIPISDLVKAVACFRAETPALE